LLRGWQRRPTNTNYGAQGHNGNDHDKKKRFMAQASNSAVEDDGASRDLAQRLPALVLHSVASLRCLGASLGLRATFTPPLFARSLFRAHM
jgi:hypothetical protein